MARVLLAEDDDDVRELFEFVIARAGHEVESVADGLEALFLYQPGRFDLLCLDLDMPRLSGTQLTRAIRHLARDRDIPILMITSSLSPEGRAEAHIAGITTMLIKPIQPSALREAVTSLLAPSRGRGEPSVSLDRLSP